MKLLDYEVLRQYVSNNNADNLFSTIPTTTFARESTPSGAEGGNYNDNTDNMYARQQCEREGKTNKIIHRKAQCWCRAEVV